MTEWIAHARAAACGMRGAHLVALQGSGCGVVVSVERLGLFFWHVQYMIALGQRWMFWMLSCVVIVVMVMVMVLHPPNTDTAHCTLHHSPF